ncbi:signal peptidase I [Bacillus sp. 165]|uniref:signal peptidase I n=1 Tax=Bacillus sp. 165 TaxID=1529117 RepID=UPI001ADB4465|nr:signal peptidase I [Bacillus sp. 165]MBO9128497.1 signal peptidase I [Bacillus sp. 165]
MKVTSTLFMVILAIAAAAVLFFVFQSKGNIEKVPSIFGYKPLTVLSNSMQPTFSAGDIVLINVDTEPKVNDVITYKHPDGILVTHRIVKTEEKDGKVFFRTKGDNNNVEDDVFVSRESILGVEAISIPKAGYVAKFVSGPVGFILLVAFPLFMFLILEIFQRLGIIGKKETDIQH